MSGASLSPRHRQRVKTACDACKRGKRRCDGSVPACGLCKRQIRECIYSAQEQQPRKRKVRDLELELERLRQCVETPEETVVNLTNDTGCRPHHARATSDGQYDAQLQPQSTHTSGSRFIRSVGPEPSQVATLDFGSSGSTNSGTTAAPFSGPTGVYSMSNNHDAAPLADSVPYAWFVEQGDDPLVYLQRRPALRQKARSAFHYQANRYGCFVDSELSRSDVFLLDLPLSLRFLHCSVLAAGANLARDPELLAIRSDLIKFSKSMAMQALPISPGIEVLQGLTILAWLDMINGDGLQMLVYNSLAGSQVTYLGLDVKSPAYENSTEFQATQSKTQVRSFWAYVFNDRIISAAIGKLPSVRWCHVQTPEYSALSDVGTWTIPDLYFDTTCRLWRLFDTVMDGIYAPSFKRLSQAERSQSIHHCEGRLHKLSSETDQRIKMQIGTSKQLPEAYYLHIGFHTAIILLNRPLLEQGMAGDLRRILQTMVTSANDICQAVQQYCRNYSFADGPPYMVFHITRACVVFLLIATSSTLGIQRSAANGLKHCLKAIDQCAQTWDHITDRSIRLIQELASRWQVVKSLPMRYSNVTFDFSDVSGLRTDCTHTSAAGWPYQENIASDINMYSDFVWSDIGSIEFD
jgi:hypothetical protein